MQPHSVLTRDTLLPSLQVYRKIYDLVFANYTAYVQVFDKEPAIYLHVYNTLDMQKQYIVSSV